MARVSRRRFLSAALAAGAAPLAGRSLFAADPAKPAISPVPAAVNAFTFDLYRQLNDKPGNVFFSPLSIEAALGMTAAGAKGNTLAQMTKALSLPADTAAAHAGFKSLFASLNDEKTPADKRGFELAVANALWGSHFYPWRKEYLGVVNDNYGGGLFHTDFREPEPARAKINAWVEGQTKERIKDLLPKGSVTEDTRLVLTNAQDYGGKRAAKLSRFVVEALDLPAPPKGAKATSALQSMQRYAPVAEPEPAPISALPDGMPLTLSHAQIDDWLTCPLKYLFAHIAHVPLAGDPQFMYGNAVHHALKIWHQHRIKGLPIDVEDVVSAFDSAWSSEGFLTVEHEERMQAQGRAALRAFIARDAAANITPLAVETEFRFKVGEDVVIGRWDRIDERPEGIVLVDYKSSEVDDADQAEKRAKESLKDGQLGLYALAYFEARQVMPARVELQFVGTGQVGSAKVESEHLERGRERVRAAAAGIRQANFKATPDQRSCSYCSYRLFCQYSAVRRA